MKGILIALLVLCGFQARSSDTLTRAQVYSFSVGDTFDYRQYVNYWDHQYIDTTYINFSRKVITNIYYSLDSNTKFIERTTIYPLPVKKDTLILNYVQECELCLDTSNYYEPCVLSFFPTSVYGCIVNTIVTHQGSPPYPYLRVFAQGLGEVMDVHDGSYLGGQVGQRDTFQLIYYAGSTSKWGSPYYTISTAINEIENSPIALLFPTPNDGSFTISTAINKLPVDFWMYDIVGNIICHKIISEANTPVDIRQSGSGIYIWKIAEQNKVVGSGKVVVQ